MPRTDVYGLGQCALDFLGIIHNYPSPDSKCEFTNLVVQGGGPIATALVALTRWGLSCAFSGLLGDDEYGRKILKSLQAENVDTSRVIIREECDSQVAFAMAEPGTGQRTIFWRRPTGMDLAPEEIDRDLIQTTGIFHTDGIFPEASLAACQIAKANAVPVSVDAGSMRPGMLEIARHADYFLASETFARDFAPGADPEDVCHRLAGFGPGVVCVTQGDQGYVALYQNKIIKNPAYPVKTVDTTGCGDLFHAGFIYGITQKWDIEMCFDFGAWAAAMVSRYLGGRKGIPTIKECQEFKKARGNSIISNE